MENNNFQHLAKPRVLRIEPASQCNLKCSHCPTGTVDIDRGLMEPEVFEQCLDYIKRNKDSLKVVVLYHGGEPLLNKNFFSYVEKIKIANPDLFVKTVTNGVALNDKNQQKIVESKLNSVEISLDGLSAQESQFIRIGSNTSKIISNVKAMLDKKKKLGNDHLKVFISTTQFINPDLNLSSQESKPPEWIMNEFEDLIKSGEIEDIKSTFAMEWPHMNINPEFYDVIEDTEDNDDKRYCDHVFHTMTVRADGNILPCCYDLTGKLKMGNIIDNAIEEVFNNKRYHTLRAKMTKGVYPGICNNCNVVKRNKYLIPKWKTK